MDRYFISSRILAQKYFEKGGELHSRGIAYRNEGDREKACDELERARLSYQLAGIYGYSEIKLVPRINSVKLSLKVTKLRDNTLDVLAKRRMMIDGLERIVKRGEGDVIPAAAPSVWLPRDVTNFYKV
tara:strand:- start:3092 stop:3475 length:384 start_codon:yes stop_codon:yes gene_type:complete